MVVAAGWPGATVDETLKQVTERLERTLQETDHLDRIRSYTVAGQTTIFVELKQSTPPAAVPDVWYQVRKNIGDMRHTLPQGVLGPFFNDDFGDTFGIIYAFTADGFNFRELRDYVEAVRSRLLQVPDVSKIEVLGAQDEQIYIEFSTERLAGLRLNLNQILATLQAQNLVRPSGTIQTEQERVFLRVTGAFDSERDIEAVNIVAGERIFRLGDIAKVRRGFADPPQPMFRVNGQPAIGLAIAMRDAGDILALGENLRKEMAEIKANLPVGIEPTLVADQAVTVDVAISDFMTSLWQAIAIILACSLVSLGMRPGAVVALAIPLTMAIVFAVMDVANIDLHRISLGALIIALGMLVDDAMTTVDAMLRRLGAGDSPDEAATFAYRTLAAPMLIGTLVTIASFVPIGFAQSSAGEYTFSIFSVVAISLIVSWLVAVLFAPLIGKALLKAPTQPKAEAKPGKMLLLYGRFVEGAIRMKWLTIGLTLAAFVVALVLSSQVQRQFFPSSDRPELTVDLTLRQNASIFATETQVKRLEDVLKADPDVDHFSSYVGPRRDPLHPDAERAAGQPLLRPVRRRRQGPGGARAPAGQAGEGPGRAVPGGRRARFAARAGPAGGLAAAVPRLRPGQGRGAASRAGAGPVDGRRHAHAARALRLDGAGAADARQDQPGPGAPARHQLAGAGRRAERHRHRHGGDAGARRHLPGQRGGARRSTASAPSFETLSSLQVATPSGRMVPLKQFATFVEEQEFPLVWRRDRVPTLTVRADVNPGVLPDSGGRRRWRRRSPSSRPSCPSSYKVATGGLYEESAGLERVGIRRGAADDRADAAGDDGHAGQLPPPGDGGGDHAAGADRRGDVAAGVQPAAGLRRHPRHPGADRHDRQERGDPDRLDRGGARRRPQRARRGAWARRPTGSGR